MKNPASYRLIAKAYSEEYCCLRGYLGLCQARGETPKQMAKFIGVSPHTIWYHYRRLEAGKIECQNQPYCLIPIIEEIKAEKNRP